MKFYLICHCGPSIIEFTLLVENDSFDYKNMYLISILKFFFFF